MSVVRDPGWFIIVNPASGGGRARRRWPALAAELRSRGIPHRVVMTESPGHGVALARALCNFRAPRFEIRADGDERSGPCLAVMAALGPACGGGKRIAPAAQVDDGMLDLVILPDLPLRRLAALAPGLYNGRAATAAGLQTIRCRSGRLRADPPCEVEADGQLIGRTPLTLQMLPLAPTVLDCDPGSRRS